MKKLFWPLLSLIFFGLVMALWFGVGATERRLSFELSKMVEFNSWLSFDVKGDDVLLQGLAPDEQSRDKLVAAVKALKYVDRITNEIAVPEKLKLYQTEFIILPDSITLRGSIPLNLDRFELINQIEAVKPGLIVYDELQQANGEPENYLNYINYLIQNLSNIDEDVLRLENNQLSAKMATITTLQSQKNAPDALKFQSSD